ncbi:hypothetical protein GCM10007938_36330 [Vibrio zhanjiangensis]|uniref:Isochorismatase n=1 Tax=Vibrio zhanjiangensis TaxID=1046128 RepID=A0ABQ6F5N3_9VIBR|nr:hypothetical protein [Vibrio zhanjiangensis]GLT19850.1 hypothetical protein GCM10007938_36330 [Vibrio zhanjiangensis]
MNLIKIKPAIALVSLALVSAAPQAATTEDANPQPILPANVVSVYKAPADRVISESQKQNVLRAVRKASEGWKAAFNRGDAKAAASFYETNSVVTAIPFGIYMGKDAAQGLWDFIIGSGYKNVEYKNTQIEVIDTNAAVLSASWEMNKAYGIITKELWVVQDDGSAKLRADEFEIVGAK